MTTYLHFDLGTNANVYEQVLDEIRRHSANPSDLQLSAGNASRYTISAPIHMKSELETLVGAVGRLVDEMDYAPCTIELRHVVAQISLDGVLITSPLANGMWRSADTKYIGADPRVTEIHHTVRVPRHAGRPPATRAGWSLTEHPDAWHFELRLSANGDASKDLHSALRREREKIASLYKGVEGASIASRVEQVVARWSAPMAPTEKNQYRVSSRRLLGASTRSALDIPDIYVEIQSNHPQPFFDAGELQPRIIANLDPCRRIARAQGFTPLVMGLGLVAVTPENGRMKFGDLFCVRGVSYGKTMEEAQTLIGAFDELIYSAVKFGRSPVLSPPERYGYVSLWRELVQPGAAARTKASRQTQPPAERNFISTIERVHQLAPPQQYKPLDEVARHLIVEWLGAKFDVRDLGLLGIPLRTEPDANGARIGGCLFALVHAPNLDLAKLDHLAVCESLFLHWGPLKLTQSSVASAVVPDSKDELVQWARDHDLLRSAIVALRKEKPGAKINLMRTRHSPAYAVYLKYSLQSFESDIENSTKLGNLMKEIWHAMTGKDRSYLFRARQLAGLPSLKLPKRVDAPKKKLHARAK